MIQWLDKFRKNKVRFDYCQPISLLPEMLVDTQGRLFRTGKATISAELAGIFDRLGSSAESWRARLEKLRTRRLFGRFFAASREKLRSAGARLNVRRVRNLAGCPAP